MVFQLKTLNPTPPSFSEFLLLLRTEEDKQEAKITRMKQHLGAAKQPVGNAKTRVMSHLQQVYSCDSSDEVSETEKLQKEIAELKSQLTHLKTQNRKKPKEATTNIAQGTVKTKQKDEKPMKQPGPSHKPNSRPRPWYCFQCGEDGHIATSCENMPNPSLVATKKKLLQEKQLQWDAQNPPSGTEQLN